jgi:hypothetical protein
LRSKQPLRRRELAVNDNKTVRLCLSKHREKLTKKRLIKRHTSTYIVIYKAHRYSNEQESRIWT